MYYIIILLLNGVGFVDEYVDGNFLNYVHVEMYYRKWHDNDISVKKNDIDNVLMFWQFDFGFFPRQRHGIIKTILFNTFFLFCP